MTASGTYNWSPAAWGGISDNSMGDGRYILYNFPAASRVNIVGGRSSIGSILAPGAAVYKLGANNTAGTVIADSFSMQYGEVHYAPFGGTLPGTSTPLPVEALSLSGTAVQGEVRLNWKATGLEAGSDLRMERSTDGVRFETRAALPPASSGSWNEAAADGAPRAYYRLSAAKDGARVYSPVWRVDLQSASMPVSVSPNPFSGSLAIGNASGTLDWTLSDIRGLRLRSGTCTGSCNVTGLEALPAGAYTIRIRQSGETSTLQLLKQ